MKVSVIGAGSFGTALAVHLAQSHDVALWARNPSQADSLRDARENFVYLPGVRLPDRIEPTSDLEQALRGREAVLTVVPSHATRELWTQAAAFLASEALVVSASKGIEQDSLQTLEEVLREVLPPRMHGRLTFLSGPSFAKEIARGVPTAVVVAGRNPEAAKAAQVLMSAERLRVYTSDDVTGIELGGALKNVIAIAAGCADGLGFGHNTRAAIITRGLAEITRLAVRRGANPLTLAGLAGMGDLVLTCTGDLSRNRQVGMQLGQGKTIKEILASMRMVAEGVKTARSAWDLARKVGVEMPITAEVYRMLYEDKPARAAVSDLLGREARHELG
jgi:glycerol-3-phosphate dehydrogenase (NAD(P)+)